jgi:hypothetical protein
MTTTSLYFELETCDRYHRADWEERLAGWFAGAASGLVRATCGDDAEFVIEPQSWHSFLGGRTFGVAPCSHYTQRPDTTFAWDSGDFPTGRQPGLFCSLSRRLFDPSRHRSFCYPLRINRQISEYPLTDARYLFGFSGNITAPIRSRLLTDLRPAADAGLGLLRQTDSVFTRIYDPAADGDRARYAEDLRQCRFILCPRGNGLSSIRLFETMEAARVPVIISDALVLPQCVNWRECAVVVPEAEIARLPDLLTARAGDWPRLAANARREWASCFAPATLLSTLVAQLRDIVRHRRRSEQYEKYFFPFRMLPDLALVQAKRAHRALQNARRTAG